MNRSRPKLLFLVNEDAFFVSHRFELGLAARAAGFDVVVAAGDTGASREIVRAGLRFVPVVFDRGGRSLRRDGETLARIVRLYADERPDVVHHVTIKPVLYGSLAARMLRIPALINAISGLGYVFLDPSFRGRALRRAVEETYRVALAHPNGATIFQNRSDLDLFLERGLVSARRVRLIPGSGVDSARFQAHPLPSGVPLVVLPARMLRDKGIGEFVQAARALRRRGVHARFVLVGAAGGSNPTSISESEIDAWVQEGSVEWWGHRRDMPEVFAAAHLVVLPSYREGFPLAIVEAQSVGRACITTDVPGCRDAIEKDQTGWLVPVRDAAALASAMETAIADRAELVRRGMLAAARVRRFFERRRIAEMHLEIYEKMIGGRARDLSPPR